MIQLMADAARKQVRPFHGDGLHVPVKGLADHMLRTGYLSCQSGQRETALFTHLLPVGFHDLGVDQYQRILIHHINDHDPLQNTHLRRSQAHAAGIIHGLKHIVYKLTDPGCDLLYRFARLTKDIIAVYANISDCHLAFSFSNV